MQIHSPPGHGRGDRPGAPGPATRPGLYGLRRDAGAQLRAADYAAAFDGLPEDVTLGKLRNLLERGKSVLGLSEGLLGMLRYLISLTQPQDWEAGQRPICWPSNDDLEQELGRSRTAVQSQIRGLVRLGWVHMRDSGNGRRYGIRVNGLIVRACGFDLSPLAVRFSEIDQAAEVRGIERAERRRLRARLGELRRMIRTLCASACEKGLPGDLWAAWKALAEVPAPRSACRETYASLVDEMEALLELVDKAWRVANSDLESKPKGSVFGAHIEPTTINSKNNTLYPTRRNEVADQPAPSSDGSIAALNDEQEVIPLGLVLQACPEVLSYIDPGLASAEWSDLEDAGRRIAVVLGISDHALRRGRDFMGARRSAVAVATILARYRAGEVQSPGGYYRAMLERSQTGELHLLASLFGLKARFQAKTD